MKKISVAGMGAGALLFITGWIYVMLNLDQRHTGNIDFAWTGQVLVMVGVLVGTVSFYAYRRGLGTFGDPASGVLLLAGLGMLLTLVGPTMFVNTPRAQLEWCYAHAPNDYLESNANFSVAVNSRGEWYCANGEFQSLIDKDVAYDESQIAATLVPAFVKPQGWKQDRRANPFPVRVGR